MVVLLHISVNRSQQAIKLWDVCMEVVVGELSAQ